MKPIKEVRTIWLNPVINEIKPNFLKIEGFKFKPIIKSKREIPIWENKFNEVMFAFTFNCGKRKVPRSIPAKI